MIEILKAGFSLMVNVIYYGCMANVRPDREHTVLYRKLIWDIGFLRLSFPLDSQTALVPKVEAITPAKRALDEAIKKLEFVKTS